MELLLWRHAEAAEAAVGEADQVRCLTARGRKQARNIASWLRGHCQEELRILSSPALRCQQTAQALELPFDVEPRLGTSAKAADLLAAAAWPAGDRSGGAVLLVGHQPTLGRLAALLLTGREYDWTFKKGALWWFSGKSRAGQTRTVLEAVIAPELSQR